MPEETMPVIKAQEDKNTEEQAHYECAFHILPTVAEPEVLGVVDELKALVARSGGTVTNEEISERYGLAYEITKQVAGVNRRFNAAHFGWMRCVFAPSALAGFTTEMKQKPEIARYLIIRLTREEAQKPFSILEARRLDADSPVNGRLPFGGASTVFTDDGEGAGPVSEAALDESLEKLIAV